MKYVEIPKPHLRTGIEGEYSDSSKYDQGGCLPAVPGARMAYDHLGKIEAPEGWTAHASWTSHGTVALILRSPPVALDDVPEGDLKGTKTFGHQEACIEVARGTLQEFNAGTRFGDQIRVEGKVFAAYRKTFSILSSK